MFTKTEIKPFENKIWLSSPTMHGEELRFMTEAHLTNWMSTVGPNLTATERATAEKTGAKYAVGLSCGTAALHLCVKLAGEKLYGKAPAGHGAIEGKRVFCSDMTFGATVNPVLYEGGIPVLIDTDAASWNMDPAALEKAFALYPDTGLVVCVELYGFPGGIDRIREVCERHGALLIEDAAEALGASVNGKPCGAFGDYASISFNGNKIITGSSGGCLLTDDREDADKARKWSTQARESAPWYQHEEIGYNYRISNVIAGVVRGQYFHLEEHIARKKAIYERYRDGLKDLPVRMNPVVSGTEPNYWLSALLIDEAYMCKQLRGKTDARFEPEKGKSCPTEIFEALASHNAEGRPIWKPMHLQPLYAENAIVSMNGDVGADVFERGLCLPSDIKMTEEEQQRIIEIVKCCFR